MHRLLAQLASGLQLTGNVRSDVAAFLFHHGLSDTLDHSVRVAVEAKRLATRFGVDESRAQVAGWLHDISAMFPVPHRPQVARNLGLEVLPEEDKAPMLLHQRLSAVVAGEVFGVTDQAVLSAIQCHTTLRANPALLDKVVFVADKTHWDQPGDPPYLEGLLNVIKLTDWLVSHGKPSALNSLLARVRTTGPNRFDHLGHHLPKAIQNR